MKYSLYLASIFILFIGCSPKLSSNVVNNNNKNSFGEKISANGAISYDDLLVKLEKDSKIKAKVKGKVLAVCQAKGCWMTIVSEIASKPSMFVKFKDYAFFMPKNISGKEVVMQGEAYYETTTVEELRHYAEDEGLSKEAISKITEPKKELKFLASGVVLLDL